jgi:hypothetical protein
MLNIRGNITGILASNRVLDDVSSSVLILSNLIRLGGMNHSDSETSSFQTSRKFTIVKYVIGNERGTTYNYQYSVRNYMHS